MKAYPKQISVRWNRRFTATLGRATYRGDLIELSTKLWRRVDPAERQRCVVHEACHLFTSKRARERGVDYVPDHGPPWKYMMGQCGYPDAPVMFAPPEGDESSKYIVYCRCRDYFVSPQKMGRIRKSRYTCRKCKSKIRTTPYGDEKEENKANDSRVKS